MFEFLSMMGTYEVRKVDNYKCDDFTVDTAWVNDNDPPYETAVAHKNFNDGDWIILEHYETKEEAQIGHNKWVEKFKNNEVSELVDDTPDSFDDIEGISRQIYSINN